MARGRIFFSESRHRAASVPFDDLSYPDTTTTRRVYDIKSHVASDTDAMTSASKRHDRDFLHSIQSKLAHPTLASPSVKTPPTLNHNRARAPPPSRSAYYAAPSVSASPAPGPRDDPRRRTWYGPTSKRVDDVEVAAYLSTPIRPPFISRVLRSGSVPPVAPSTATAPRWFPSARGTSVSRWTPSSYQTYGSGRSYLQSHPDQEDVVVGVAPTARYGDIVIGIPYRKQYMFGIQHGLDAVEDYPRIPVATRVTPPNFAYRTKTRLESPYEDVEAKPYHRATYSSPNYTTRASSYAYPTTQYVGQSSGIRTALTTPGSRISTYGYSPVRASSARVAPKRSEYDFELSSTAKDAAAPKVSFADLRLRATLARDKANQHKSMITKYMPRDLDAAAAADTSRGLTSSIRIGPSVELRAPTGSTHHHHPPPSTAAAPSPAAAEARATSSKSIKPQVSETRQRVRSLLCKSKKDPHYFD